MYLIDAHAALGTAWWIEVSAALSTTTIAELKITLLAAINLFEARYSRFLSTSLISTLNVTGTIDSPDQELIATLRYGQDLYLRTNTHFNMLVGAELVARGYDTDYRFTPSGESIVIPDPTEALEISDDHIVLYHGQIDIGGYGKGYLIDELAVILFEYGVEEFFINGGGDMYGTTLGGTPIEIYLEHPTKAKTYIGTTTLHNQGFAASSPYKRAWRHGDETLTHIVGENQAGWSSFVVAASARDADAFATASILMSDNEISKLVAEERVMIARYSPTASLLNSLNLPIMPIKD